MISLKTPINSHFRHKNKGFVSAEKQNNAFAFI